VLEVVLDGEVLEELRDRRSFSASHRGGIAEYTLSAVVQAMSRAAGHMPGIKLTEYRRGDLV
jgi:hypothetical protein